MIIFIKNLNLCFHVLYFFLVHLFILVVALSLLFWSVVLIVRLDLVLFMILLFHVIDCHKNYYACNFIKEDIIHSRRSQQGRNHLDLKLVKLKIFILYPASNQTKYETYMYTWTTSNS